MVVWVSSNVLSGLRFLFQFIPLCIIENTKKYIIFFEENVFRRVGSWEPQTLNPSAMLRGPSKRQKAVLKKLQTALNATREAWRLTIEAYTDLNEIKKADDQRGRQESSTQREARTHVRNVASKTEACYKELHFAHHVYAEQLKTLQWAAETAPKPTVDHPAFSDGEDADDDAYADSGSKRRKTALTV